MGNILDFHLETIWYPNGNFFGSYFGYLEYFFYGLSSHLVSNFLKIHVIWYFVNYVCFF